MAPVSETLLRDHQGDNSGAREDRGDKCQEPGDHGSAFVHTNCTGRMSKYMLFFYNLFFWLCGAIVLGLGIWLRLDRDSWRLLHLATGDQSNKIMAASTILLISVGGMVACVGFVGCCGAILDNNMLILLYTVVLALILTLQISVAVLALVFMHQTNGRLYANMEQQPAGEEWKFMEEKLWCCDLAPSESGTSRRIRMYNESKIISRPCCDIQSGETSVMCMRLKRENFPKHKMRVMDCHKALNSWLWKHVSLFAGVGFCFSFIQILGLVLSILALKPRR